MVLFKNNSSNSDVTVTDMLSSILIAKFLFQSELLSAEINYMVKRVIHTCHLYTLVTPFILANPVWIHSDTLHQILLKLQETELQNDHMNLRTKVCLTVRNQKQTFLAYII